MDPTHASSARPVPRTGRQHCTEQPWPINTKTSPPSSLQTQGVQDKLGNTALHLACSKNYRLTVRALLNFECVDTLIRNNKMELPEEGSIKSNIKKLVCRHRTHSSPSPPARVQDVPPVAIAFSQPLATPLPRPGPSLDPPTLPTDYYIHVDCVEFLRPHDHLASRQN